MCHSIVRIETLLGLLHRLGVHECVSKDGLFGLKLIRDRDSCNAFSSSVSEGELLEVGRKGPESQSIQTSLVLL